jgi:hypothetical protein
MAKRSADGKTAKILAFKQKQDPAINYCRDGKHTIMCHRVMFFAANDLTDTGEGLVLHHDPTNLRTNSAAGNLYLDTHKQNMADVRESNQLGREALHQRLAEQAKALRSAQASPASSSPDRGHVVSDGSGSDGESESEGDAESERSSGNESGSEESAVESDVSEPEEYEESESEDDISIYESLETRPQMPYGEKVLELVKESGKITRWTAIRERIRKHHESLPLDQREGDVPTVGALRMSFMRALKQGGWTSRTRTPLAKGDYDEMLAEWLPDQVKGVTDWSKGVEFIQRRLKEPDLDLQPDQMRKYVSKDTALLALWGSADQVELDEAEIAKDEAELANWPRALPVAESPTPAPPKIKGFFKPAPRVKLDVDAKLEQLKAYIRGIWKGAVIPGNKQLAAKVGQVEGLEMFDLEAWESMRDQLRIELHGS